MGRSENSEPQNRPKFTTMTMIFVIGARNMELPILGNSKQGEVGSLQKEPPHCIRAAVLSQVW